MKARDFTRDWAATRGIAENLASDRFRVIRERVGTVRYTIARWSAYDDDLDRENAEHYLRIPMRAFGEALGAMLGHTVWTGIGKLVTFRDRPRFLLEPYREWRSYVAARFGTSRHDYLDSVRWSRIGELLLEEAADQTERKVRSLERQISATEATLRDLEIDYGVIEKELSHLRQRVRRLPAE